MELTAACLHCGSEVEGRRVWCSDRCKLRAYRRRKAGLPQDAYRDGANQGTLSLAERKRRRDVIAIKTARPRAA